MCGVPAHNAEPYLQRLIRRLQGRDLRADGGSGRGAQRGGKRLVHRDVVRVVTPGTITEDACSSARRPISCPRWPQPEGDGLAWLDLSTGEFLTAPVADGTLAAELDRIDPREMLVPDRLLAPRRGGPYGASSTSACRRCRIALRRRAGERRLGELRRRGARWLRRLQARRARCPGACRLCRADPEGPSAAACARRAGSEPGSQLQIDPATRRNLELLSAASRRAPGSLLAAIDRTVTGAGGRLLAAGWPPRWPAPRDPAPARRGQAWSTPPSCAPICARR